MDIIMIIVAAVVAWLLGMVWYHPKVFGTIRSKGVAPELCGTPGPVGMGLSLLKFLAIAYVAEAVADLSYNPLEFWRVMLVVALAFFLGICTGGHMDGKGKNTYIADGGYVGVAVMIASAIVYYT